MEASYTEMRQNGLSIAPMTAGSSRTSRLWAPASATSALRSARSCPVATSPTPWAVSSTRFTPSTARRATIRWSTRYSPSTLTHLTVPQRWRPRRALRYDHGELPRSSKESDLKRQPQRKVSSLVGSHNMHRILTPKWKGKIRMATLSVLKFNDPYGADRVMVALQGMQERELITLEDAAIVSWPQGNRKPKTRELHGGSAGWGAFWGFLIGMIFFVPFLGAAIGGMSGAMRDVGIDDDFIKQVREKVTEGTSALFALTSGATAVDKVVDELKAYDFEIISTNLPEEQEQKLREAFAHEG